MAQRVLFGLSLMAFAAGFETAFFWREQVCVAALCEYRPVGGLTALALGGLVGWVLLVSAYFAGLGGRRRRREPFRSFTESGPRGARSPRSIRERP